MRVRERVEQQCVQYLLLVLCCCCCIPLSQGAAHCWPQVSQPPAPDIASFPPEPPPSLSIIIFIACPFPSGLPSEPQVPNGPSLLTNKSTHRHLDRGRKNAHLLRPSPYSERNSKNHFPITHPHSLLRSRSRAPRSPHPPAAAAAAAVCRYWLVVVGSRWRYLSESWASLSCLQRCRT